MIAARTLPNVGIEAGVDARAGESRRVVGGPRTRCTQKGLRRGNAAAAVDDLWFRYSEPAPILGRWLPCVPVEEMLWQKAYIMEHERFDGADVAHLIKARAEKIDWHRLVRRFGSHWPVLLAHLLLFRFIFPAERNRGRSSAAPPFS